MAEDKKSSKSESKVTEAPIKKKVVPKVSYEQYITLMLPNLDKYIQAYYQPVYHGILKSIDEWTKELTGKL